MESDRMNETKIKELKKRLYAEGEADWEYNDNQWKK